MLTYKLHRFITAIFKGINKCHFKNCFHFLHTKYQ